MPQRHQLFWYRCLANGVSCGVRCIWVGFGYSNWDGCSLRVKSTRFRVTARAACACSRFFVSQRWNGSIVGTRRSAAYQNSMPAHLRVMTTQKIRRRRRPACGTTKLLVRLSARKVAVAIMLRLTGPNSAEATSASTLKPSQCSDEPEKPGIPSGA